MSVHFMQVLRGPEASEPPGVRGDCECLRVFLTVKRQQLLQSLIVVALLHVGGSVHNHGRKEGSMQAAMVLEKELRILTS